MKYDLQTAIGMSNWAGFIFRAQMHLHLAISGTDTVDNAL